MFKFNVLVIHYSLNHVMWCLDLMAHWYAMWNTIVMWIDVCKRKKMIRTFISNQYVIKDLRKSITVRIM